MADPAALLEKLRPLHAGPGIEAALPLLLAGVAGAALALALWPWLARRGRVRREALAALAASRRDDPGEWLLAQAGMLRSVAERLDDKAQRPGPAWPARLDHHLATTFFTQDEGRWFAEGLYRPGSLPDPQAVQRTLQKLFAGIKR